MQLTRKQRDIRNRATMLVLEGMAVPRAIDKAINEHYTRWPATIGRTELTVMLAELVPLMVKTRLRPWRHGEAATTLRAMKAAAAALDLQALAPPPRSAIPEIPASWSRTTTTVRALVERRTATYGTSAIGRGHAAKCQCGHRETAHVRHAGDGHRRMAAFVRDRLDGVTPGLVETTLSIAMRQASNERIPARTLCTGGRACACRGFRAR